MNFALICGAATALLLYTLLIMKGTYDSVEGRKSLLRFIPGCAVGLLAGVIMVSSACGLVHVAMLALECAL